jgi:hypothetical protein
MSYEKTTLEGEDIYLLVYDGLSQIVIYGSTGFLVNQIYHLSQIIFSRDFF